jgi:hypothetical protein
MQAVDPPDATSQNLGTEKLYLVRPWRPIEDTNRARSIDPIGAGPLGTGSATYSLLRVCRGLAASAGSKPDLATALEAEFGAACESVGPSFPCHFGDRPP